MGNLLKKMFECYLKGDSRIALSKLLEKEWVIHMRACGPTTSINVTRAGKRVLGFTEELGDIKVTSKPLHLDSFEWDEPLLKSLLQVYHKEVETDLRELVCCHSVYWNICVPYSSVELSSRPYVIECEKDGVGRKTFPLNSRGTRPLCRPLELMGTDYDNDCLIVSQEVQQNVSSKIFNSAGSHIHYLEA